MNKECTEVVNLAALAAKVTEEAKKAEAHARAAKAFARKVTKEADCAYDAASNLLAIARDLVGVFLQSSDVPPNANVEDIEKEIMFERYWRERGVDGKALHAIMRIPHVKPADESRTGSGVGDLSKFNSEYAADLCMTEDQQKNIQKMLKEGLVEKSSPMNWRPMSADRANVKLQDYSSNDILMANIGLGIQNNQNPALAVGTKRRSRKRSKASAMGIPSPLLSREDLTIVKRSTSPNPSQTSGLSPFVGTHHKYSVRRNRSSTSQQMTSSGHDDDGQSDVTEPLAQSQKPNPENYMESDD